MKMKKTAVIFLTASIFLVGGCKKQQDNNITIEKLRCEYLVNPLGIDVTKPRLSWVLQSGKKGQKQTAYQILVAGSKERLQESKTDLWDSGKINSDQSIHIEYDGKPLESRMSCYWKVKVWDKDAKESQWSEPSMWSMGLLKKSDWKAKWISAPSANDSCDVKPSPFFRREFTTAKPIKKATAYICGLGYYELYINGRKIGDHVLDPAFTRYDKRALYVTYDVTSQLLEGKNAVGVILGNGWYNMHTEAVWYFNKAVWRKRPTVLCRLEIEFADDTTQIVTSDQSWKVSTGPIVFESIRNGETYDARLEKQGWNKAGYNDSDWKQAQEVSGLKGKLTAQMQPAIKVTKTIRPKSVTEVKPGVFVFDLGQNITGWAQINVSGPAGTKIVMKYSERINDDGTIDQTEPNLHLRQGLPQTDTYILKGSGKEIWEPRFVYHGFQYVQVEGLPAKPTLNSLRGKVAHTSFEQIGNFRCSNEMFNKTQKNTLWSYVGNFHGYPTDCPHREKNGWTGDAQLAGELGLYNFDSAAAYTKWLNDIRDEQQPNGVIPAIIPTSGWGYHWGNGPSWDCAYTLIPWYMYQYKGDKRILAEHYDSIKKYVDYLTTKADGHIVSIGLGDWASPKAQTPPQITSTGYYYFDAVIVSKTAELLGKNEDAKKYARLAANIKKAFIKKFYTTHEYWYHHHSQTALSCTLYHDFAEGKLKEKVLKNLLKQIKYQDFHLATGILGTKYILNTLTENGKVDIAYKIANQKTYPGWGYWIELGATTLWEHWDGTKSRNHIMYGDISAWFYKTLAGINPDPDKPGFKNIIIRPHPVGDLKWVKAEHESMYGKIASSWQKKNGKFTLDIDIPVNTSATVYVPARKKEDVIEPQKQSEHIQYLRIENGYAVFKVGSGKYKFASKLKE
ncbi:MAG: glycoside hydrolase family 78 protein [Planctomycetota bacterium]|jgi:alpha-L-rhamnosidase